MRRINDTWTWDGSNWTEQFPMNSPPLRYAHAMVYESAQSQSVMFRGFDNELNTYDDTWAWDGANWTQESPQTSPPSRGYHSMAYDSAHGLAVLFGGENFLGGQNSMSQQFFSDTWTWGVPVVVPPPEPTINSVVNGASFVGAGIAPGEIATIFGTDLTSSTGINLTSGLPLPTAFQQVAVMVNGSAVPLFAVDNVNGQQQINFQVPFEVSGTTANVAVVNNMSTGPTVAVPVLPAQPGIFNYTAGGVVFGAILHANFQLADTADPAVGGETVLIFCTGLGAVSSAPADGAAGNGQETTAMPVVTIGGTNAPVSFSWLAPSFVGLYQIQREGSGRAEIRQSTGGDHYGKHFQQLRPGAGSLSGQSVSPVRFKGTQPSVCTPCPQRPGGRRAAIRDDPDEIAKRFHSSLPRALRQIRVATPARTRYLRLKKLRSRLRHVGGLWQADTAGQVVKTWIAMEVVEIRVCRQEGQSLVTSPVGG